MPNALGRSVLIRADASASIGNGHLRRCIALADAFQQIGINVLFVTKDLGVDSVGLIAAAGYQAEVLPNIPECAADWAWDADATIAVAGQREWLAVIVDHYGLDAQWHVRVGGALASQIVVIDDLADRPLAASIVIDPNYAQDHRAKFAGRVTDQTRLLAGTRFALLDQAYVKAAPYAFSSEVHSIGIFLGGADVLGLTLAMARSLREQGFRGPIGVATTSSNPHHAEIAAATDWLGCAPVIDAPNLADFFTSHDIQIIAAGGARWECACLGVPALTFAATENAREVLAALAEVGAFALWQGEHSAAAIAAAALQLAGDADQRKRLSENGPLLVDGHGAMRAALAIAASEMHVRPATMDDARLMYAWRNDPSVRAVSRNAAAIPWDGHQEWLRSSLKRPDRLIGIVLIGKQPVGVVRYDRHSSGIWELSIYLDPLLQGFGLGTLVLLAGDTWLAEEIAEPVDLQNEFMPGNLASQKMFEKAGYFIKGGNSFKKIYPSGWSND